MKIVIDSVSYTEKPNKRAFSSITYRLVDNKNIYEFDKSGIDWVAKKIGEQGHTFQNIFNGKRNNENFVSANFIALDFDGEISIEEFNEIDKTIEIHPTFMYHTFSSTVEIPKFRAIYVFEKALDINEFKQITSYLYSFFGEKTDNCCLREAQMYLGGKNPLILANVDNVIVDNNDIISKCKKSTFLITYSIKESPNVTSQPTIPLTSTGEVELLSSKLLDKLLSIDGCEILNKLKNGATSSYWERFQLLTNFALVKGGEKAIYKLFPSDKLTQSIKNMDYYRTRYPRAKSCSNCPNYSSCTLKPHSLISHVNEKNVTVKHEGIELKQAEDLSL